eukprot:6234231-Pyramimonas_sp.AAC.1
MEVFSPPRVARFAQHAGISCLGSFDKEGGWDFTRKGDRNKFEALVRKKKPWMVLLEPPCGPFTISRNAYAHREITEAQRQKDAEALLLLGFAMEIAMIQVEGGR